MVYRDTYRKIEQFSVPVITERKLLVDLVGGTQIGDWISKGYPLELKQGKFRAPFGLIDGG